MQLRHSLRECQLVFGPYTAEQVEELTEFVRLNGPAPIRWTDAGYFADKYRRRRKSVYFKLIKMTKELRVQNQINRNRWFGDERNGDRIEDRTGRDANDETTESSDSSDDETSESSDDDSSGNSSDPKSTSETKPKRNGTKWTAEDYKTLREHIKKHPDDPKKKEDIAHLAKMLSTYMLILYRLCLL